MSANGSTRPEADFAPNLGKVGGAIGEIASFGWIATEEAAQEGSEVPIDGLIPYARNARTPSDAQVAQIAGSIREFGFTNPVLCDEDGGIIAGHGRVLAARQLGMPSVPRIVLTGLTEAQRRAYVIADNKLALNAGWDPELLRLELGELKLGGFDLSLTGFGDLELKDIMTDRNGGLTDPDDRFCAIWSGKWERGS